jgi:uncharacterized protein
MTAAASTTQTQPAKPLPVLDGMNRPFWEAARQGQLRMQCCTECRHIRYPISHVCPNCLSENVEWVGLSGRGTVYSSIVFHQVYDPGFANDVPYNVSLVQLEEGPRMFSNVVGVPPSEVKVGAKVEVFFDPVTPDISIPRFRQV